MKNIVLQRIKSICFTAIIIIISSLVASAPSCAAPSQQPLKLNHGWEYHLGDNQDSLPLTSNPDSKANWIRISDLAKPVPVPKGVNAVWYHLKLPKGSWINPCVYLQRVNGQSLMIYVNEQKVYEKIRDRTRYDNKILIPLGQVYQGKTLTLQVFSKKANPNMFGPIQSVFLGNHDDLIIKYFQNGLINIVLGFSLALLAFIMMFCSFFLKNSLKKSWFSLCLVTFILGIAEAIYPNNLGPFFPFFDQYSTIIIDIATFILFPILTYFFEQLFGPGYKLFIRRLWQIQIVYSFLCLLLMILNFSSFVQMKSIYTFFANEITGFFCILQFLTLMGTAIYFTIKGNIDAKIFTAGFLVFALISSCDIIISFTINTNNRFSIWKWGLLAFIMSLYVILGRRIIANYNQVVTYSYELELKNKELDAMWQEIKVSRDQLANLNKTLEERIVERTQQLAVTNIELSSVNEELTITNQELIHTMEILKKTQDQLVESEKLAALGQLIAGITHEINTPFGAIRASIGNITESLNTIFDDFLPFFQKLSLEVQSDFLKLLRTALSTAPEMMTSREERHLRKSILKKLNEYDLEKSEECADVLATAGIKDIQSHLAIIHHPESALILKMLYTVSGLKRNLKTIEIAAERTAKVVFALKSYTHQPKSDEMVQADIVQGIETVLTLYQNKIKNSVHVTCNYQNIPPIWCFPDELNQVWTNIIDNALYSMKYQGTLTIDVCSEKTYIVVNITDSGSGIPDELTDKIFKPFFTTKPQGEGSGMGLDIVNKIIDKHHGKVKLESIPGKTTFSFFIPIVDLH